MSEGIPPQPTKSPEAATVDPLEGVFNANVYANSRFPQNYAAIYLSTLHAIFSSPDPQATLKEYRSNPLSEARATHMAERAMRAHAAFLSPDRQPKIDVKRMMRHWEEEQKHILDLVKTAEAPGLPGLFRSVSGKSRAEDHRRQAFATMRALTATATEILKSEDLSPFLVRYRDSFRENGSASDRIAMKREILRRLFTSLERIVEEDSSIDKETAERFLGKLRKMTVL